MAESNPGKHVKLALPLADFDQALRRDTESGSNAIPKHSRGHTGAWLAGIAVFLGCCLVVACGVIAFLLNGQHRVAVAEPGGVHSQSTSDPKAQFVAFLPGEIEQLKKQVPALTVNKDFAFDVRNTDSLVSPYFGTCSVEAVWKDAGGVWPNTSKGDLRMTIETMHAYQDGKWVTKGGICHVPSQSLARTGSDNWIKAFSLRFEDFAEITSFSLVVAQDGSRH